MATVRYSSSRPRRESLGIIFAAAPLLCALVMPPPVSAQPCPGMVWAGLVNALVFTVPSQSPSHPLSILIGAGCAAPTLIGDVDNCTAIKNHPASAQFVARWSNTNERTQDATGGCIFMCDGGTCVVRNDGLPVELLHFGVE